MKLERFLQQEQNHLWKKPEANIKELWDILGKIDRYDVRDDAAEKMLVDIKIAD